MGQWYADRFGVFFIKTFSTSLAQTRIARSCTPSRGAPLPSGLFRCFALRARGALRGVARFARLVPAPRTPIA